MLTIQLLHNLKMCLHMRYTCCNAYKQVTPPAAPTPIPPQNPSPVTISSTIKSPPPPPFNFTFYAFSAANAVAFSSSNICLSGKKRVPAISGLSQETNKDRLLVCCDVS